MTEIPETVAQPLPEDPALARRMLPGSTPPTPSQLSAGTKKSSAPASRAAAIFCWMPPIGPTSPLGVMVPVPAMSAPSVIDPGVRVS